MTVRLCGFPGCQKLAQGYYCPEHRALADRRKAEGGKKLFRGTQRKASAQWHSLYSSARWRAMRSRFLAGHPVCVQCGARATVADHIVPHRGDVSLFYNEANLQALCARCHSAKTLAENGFFRTGSAADR